MESRLPIVLQNCEVKPSRLSNNLELLVASKTGSDACIISITHTSYEKKMQKIIILYNLSRYHYLALQFKN